LIYSTPYPASSPPLPLSHSLLSFFSSTRPPPTPPLFPYTTLFRSDQGMPPLGPPYAPPPSAAPPRPTYPSSPPDQWSIPPVIPRSEEHTSELQSLTNLVCRLLLEKKKKTKHRTQHINPLYTSPPPI